MKICKIKEIATINAKKFDFSKERDCIQYIDTSCVTNGYFENGTIYNSSNIDTIPSRAKRAVKLGTTIISTVRPNLNHFGYFDCLCDNIVVSTGFLTADVKNGIDSRYLYYVLTSKIICEKLIALSTTSKSSYPSFRPEDFKELNISIDENSSTQKKIGSLLSALDRKVANNNAICKELEAMAKTLYDYWFLQFDFPDDEGKPYKSSGGKMVYNDTLKREIPEGWEVGKLGDLIASQKNGDWGSEIKKKIDDIEVCCFRGADFVSITKDFHFTAPIRYIHKSSEESILQPGDLVIEISGGSTNQATGRIGYINREFLNRSSNQMVCSNFCKAIALTNNELQYWFYQTWQALYDTGIMFNFESKTTSIKNLMFDAFVRDIKVCVPNEKIVKVFNAICMKYYCLIQKKLAESEDLASLRDFLLPLLMNGQVKVG